MHPWRRIALLAGIAMLWTAETDAQDLVSPHPRTSSGWRFRPNAALAYDSFGQRYVVADEDTLDLLDEVIARFMATLEHRGRTEFRLRNTLGLGQEATRNDLQMLLRRTFGRLDLRLQDELRYKAYRSLSDYSLSSNYLVNTLRSRAALRLAPHWKLEIDDRFESATFASRNRYNYDYRRNDVGARLDLDYGIFSFVNAGYAYGWRSVPDSSAIDYKRHRFLCTWDHEVASMGLTLENQVERRLYGDPGVRSHYVDYNGLLAMRIPLHPEIRLRPEYRATALWYDTPDSIYSNSNEHSVQVLLEGDVSESTTLSLGPRTEVRRTRGGIDRAYNQWGLQGSVSFLRGRRFWLQFTNEVGKRNHLGDGDAFFTDYVFNWSTLYLTYEFLQRTTLDLFVSLNPENHEDKAFDTTTLLVSASLTYGLR